MRIKYFDLQSFKEKGIEWIKALRDQLRTHGKREIELNKETREAYMIGWNMGKQSFIMEFLELKEDDIK